MDKSLAEALLPLRERIDAIDDALLALLNERASLAVEVGEIKKAFGANDLILKPEREAQIIRRLEKTAPSCFPTQAIAPVWTEIISACRGLEKSLTVAYLGPEGSFSEQAALEHYGSAIEKLSCESFEEIFHAIETGKAQVGMVPVENSTEGAVNRTQDLLLNANVKIHGERVLSIEHCLLHQSGDLRSVTQIMAHPQALAQCHQWLSKHFPHLKRIPSSSNAQATKMAAKDPSVLAIAGKRAAAIYQLHCVHENIQDDVHNKTRFLAIGLFDVLPSGDDKTSLIFANPNRAGMVYELLEPFAKHQVSMTNFVSRPARNGQWEYYFYVDILGHVQQEKVRDALEELKTQSAFLKLLGSYPRQINNA